ncbi:hypothetical protein LX86_006923 [Lentzea aerocolonigenes]|nr:hypothetical protein [Lentzea aerocolonigenes]
MTLSVEREARQDGNGAGACAWPVLVAVDGWFKDPLSKGAAPQTGSIVRCEHELAVVPLEVVAQNLDQKWRRLGHVVDRRPQRVARPLVPLMPGGYAVGARATRDSGKTFWCHVRRASIAATINAFAAGGAVSNRCSNAGLPARCCVIRPRRVRPPRRPWILVGDAIGVADQRLRRRFPGEDHGVVLSDRQLCCSRETNGEQRPARRLGGHAAAVGLDEVSHDGQT